MFLAFLSAREGNLVEPGGFLFYNITSNYYVILTYDGCPEGISHFEYLENRSRGLVVPWQPVRGDLTAHP